MSKYVILFPCGHRRTRKNQNSQAGCLKCTRAHLTTIRPLAIAACVAKRAAANGRKPFLPLDRAVVKNIVEPVNGSGRSYSAFPSKSRRAS